MSLQGAKSAEMGVSAQRMGWMLHMCGASFRFAAQALTISSSPHRPKASFSSAPEDPPPPVPNWSGRDTPTARVHSMLCLPHRDSDMVSGLQLLTLALNLHLENIELPDAFSYDNPPKKIPKPYPGRTSIWKIKFRNCSERKRVCILKLEATPCLFCRNVLHNSQYQFRTFLGAHI